MNFYWSIIVYNGVSRPAVQQGESVVCIHVPLALALPSRPTPNPPPGSSLSVERPMLWQQQTAMDRDGGRLLGSILRGNKNKQTKAFIFKWNRTDLSLGLDSLFVIPMKSSIYTRCILPISGKGASSWMWKMPYVFICINIIGDS